MDVAFDGMIDHILAIYQDDLTTYSNQVEDHCNRLEKIFKRDLEGLRTRNTF